MSESFETPDFPSEEYDRESLEVVERLARYRAMPRRHVVQITPSTSCYEMECGHVVGADYFMDKDGCLRCLPCYEAGLRAARRMIDAL